MRTIVFVLVATIATSPTAALGENEQIVERRLDELRAATIQPPPFMEGSCVFSELSLSCGPIYFERQDGRPFDGVP